jgi:hypothetical protein
MPLAILFTDRVFDAAIRAVVWWRGETERMNSGATDKSTRGWGIKLSRGKFNAPYLDRNIGFEFDCEKNKS